jgi:serine/threonine protein kinase
MSASRKLAVYREIRELGATATGRVVLASQRRSHQLVAIKHLSAACFADEVRRETFRREAKYLVSLTGPNIVRTLEYLESREGAAIVMEAVEGPSLRRLLTATGPCRPEAALALLRGTLITMAATHSHGIVHRDHKPENVFVDAAGHGRLTDIGIAAPVGHGVPATGTPAYLSPEQWSGWPATKAGDLYAASVVLFECVTGRPPFGAQTLRGLQAHHEISQPPLAGVPAPLRQLVATGLAKLPALRFRDAERFLAEVERVGVAAYGTEWSERGARELAGVASVLVSPLLWADEGAYVGAGADGAEHGPGSAVEAAIDVELELEATIEAKAESEPEVAPAIGRVTGHTIRTKLEAPVGADPSDPVHDAFP